jgi:hypothetical protein
MQGLRFTRRDGVNPLISIDFKTAQYGGGFSQDEN